MVELSNVVLRVFSKDGYEIEKGTMVETFDKAVGSIVNSGTGKYKNKMDRQITPG